MAKEPEKHPPSHDISKKDNQATPDIVKRDQADTHPHSADPQVAKMEIQPRPIVDEPVKTVQQEQVERSAEIEAKGVERWKAERDDRDPKDRPQTIVPGVSPTSIDDDDDRPKKK